MHEQFVTCEGASWRRRCWTMSGSRPHGMRLRGGRRSVHGGALVVAGGVDGRRRRVGHCGRCRRYRRPSVRRLVRSRNSRRGLTPLRPLGRNRRWQLGVVGLINSRRCNRRCHSLGLRWCAPCGVPVRCAWNRRRRRGHRGRRMGVAVGHRDGRKNGPLLAVDGLYLEV